MTKGPRRLVLDQYLDSAAPGAVKNAGRDWKEKADDLQELGEALKQAAAQAELRIGEQTLTGPALRAGMEESAVSMLAKSEQLRTAGEALRQVGQQLADTRDTRDSLADLGAKPSPYQAPPKTPGVETTPEEIQAQADASKARSDERSAWQSEYDKQEAKSLALTKEMDAAFLGAIPPMKDIHGQKDPTEPPPNVPSGPGGTYLPGTQAPPPTGSGNGGGDHGTRLDEGRPIDEGKDDGGRDDGKDDGKDDDKPKPPPTLPPTVITNPPPEVVPTEHRPEIRIDSPTTTVTGSSQNGVTYQPTGAQVSAPGGAGVSGGASAGASAAALGAAGGAGGLAAGAIRPGSVSGAASGSAPVRAIGSTGRAGSAGALSRSAGSSAAGRGAGSAGSPASRSAGSAAGRGASTGSSAGRGGAGGRGAGSGSGSRSGGRGSSGARSAGAGAGTGGSRGGRKGERDQTTDRDSLVYDQDWLGDDDVAPGVLD